MALQPNISAKVIKQHDLSPRFVIRLWNEKKAIEDFSKRYNKSLYVEYPANHQFQQKGLLRLIQEKHYNILIDPATMRLAYSAQQDVKGLQQLPYAPGNFAVISPSYLSDNTKQKEYVKLVIDEQINLGAKILISPYHYIHNTNVPATPTRNPVDEWFDLDIKLLKESIDYLKERNHSDAYPLYAGICLNGESLVDQSYKSDFLNFYSAMDCDGFFIYVDCIDNKTNSTVLYHYINTLLELQRNTGKPVIAGRINSIGLGLLCAGLSGFSSGTARFENFTEDLYKESTDSYNMYERYYIPELLGTIPILKKTPTKLQTIIDKLGSCQCYYCKDKSYVDIIQAPNNKLHFLELIHQEVQTISDLDQKDRINYFLKRIDEAINNYKALPSVFKASEYQHLKVWQEVFLAIK